MTFLWLWTGLSPLALAGVAAATVLAVTTLYLLKLRRRQVAVPFLPLWTKLLGESQTNRFFSNLKRLLSLAIALLVALALVAAIGDPRPDAITRDGRTVLVMVDASTSMATMEDGKSRLQRAIEHARSLTSNVGGQDRVLVAQLDQSATPLSPFTSDVHVLEDALLQIEQTHLPSRLSSGMELAVSILSQSPNPELVLLTDGNFELGSPEVASALAALKRAHVRITKRLVGHAKENVAVTAFAVRRYPLDKTQNEVLVEVWNSGEAGAEVEVELLGDGQVIDVRTLSLTPGERRREMYPNLGGAGASLEAKLTRKTGIEAQTADDHAFATIPERRRARVCVATDNNLYLRAALLLDEYLDVTETANADDCLGEFDVSIFDRVVPSSTAHHAAIYIAPGLAGGDASHLPLQAQGEIDRPFFDQQDRDHPIFAFTALRDVNIARAVDVELQREDRALAWDQRGPLIVEGRREGFPFLALTFDIRESDLPLRVAWPILLLNAIDYFGDEQAGYLSSFRIGDRFDLPAPGEASTLRLQTPDGRERLLPVQDGHATFSGRTAGFYRAGETLLAANLTSDLEGRIAPSQELQLGDETLADANGFEAGLRSEPWLYFLLFAWAILLVEWWTYHRRVTL